MIQRQQRSLIERLQKYVNRFEEIRNQFGLDDRIGLGSFPNAHEIYAPGMLVPVSSVSKEQLANPVYTKTTVTPTNESPKIIQYPDMTKEHRAVVSIYQKKGWWDGASFEPGIVGASDLVLEGIVAHELTHWVKQFGELPQSVHQVILQRESDFMQLLQTSADIARKFGNEASRQFMDKHYESTHGDADIDVAASLIGFKGGVLAKINYVIKCLKTYLGPKEHPQYMTPIQAIKQLEYRKQQVLKYT